jgi:iron complex outermembrane receptor protein
MRFRFHSFGHGSAVLLVIVGLLFAGNPAAAADADPAGGTLKGQVTLSDGSALHKATVSISQLGRTTETDEQGNYEFRDLPPGTYDVVVRAPALTDARRLVQITAGETTTLDFQLRLATLRQQVVVTASGREQSPLETFQAVNVVDAITLAEKPQTSVGDALEGTPGVAKRSSGPGSSRPVLRGFDGDRVLIMQDGISTGTLSSQSADHGEALDVLNLERLEVVKGPATLLWGSNALGGVVSAITAHGQIHEHVHEGPSGYLSVVGGSANGQFGGGGGFEYGIGKWMLWGDGSGNRTGDYHSPIGEVPNSHSRLANSSAGFGRYAEKTFFNFAYGYENARYGVPPVGDEVVDLALRRHNLRFNGGFRNLASFVNSFRLTLDYSDYHHEEIPEDEPPETLFDNDVFSYRGVFQQRQRGRWTGSFGFSGLHRDYTVTGDEALTPPVTQNNIAVFTLQEFGFERFRIQLGGRLDHTRYDVVPTTDPVRTDRSFTGLSGAAGIHVPLWPGGAFVTNYTHSYRAPALEELYNFGPHPGNQAFEIGNAALKREFADGVDLSLRHQSPRVRAELNVFYYFIHDFVFLAPTGDIEDDLIEAEFLQGDSRFIGSEASLDLGLHPNLWLNLGVDVVDAQLESTVTSPETGVTTPAGTSLPRIPPLRGRVGLDFNYKGLSLRPELVLARDQQATFVNETRTAGYGVVNLNASYTIARQHAVHVVSLAAFNLADQLYRNHLSFIKDVAPEIGRGVRVGYTVRFF